MNKVETEGLEQLSASVETLDFIQQIGIMAGELAKIAGCNVILSGCEVKGSTIEPGIMIVRGEIMRFAGGVLDLSQRFHVEEERKGYGGQEIYKVRTIRVGGGREEFTTGNLRTISLRTMQDDITAAQKSILNNANAISDHAKAANPHKTTKTTIGLENVTNDKQATEVAFDKHLSADNPHGITATSVGLGLVNNTADLEKPISEKVQAELSKIKRRVGEYKRITLGNNIVMAVIPQDEDISNYQVYIANEKASDFEIKNPAIDTAVTREYHYIVVVGDRVQQNLRIQLGARDYDNFNKDVLIGDCIFRGTEGSSRPYISANPKDIFDIHITTILDPVGLAHKRLIRVAKSK